MEENHVLESMLQIPFCKNRSFLGPFSEILIQNTKCTRKLFTKALTTCWDFLPFALSSSYFTNCIMLQSCIDDIQHEYVSNLESLRMKLQVLVSESITKELLDIAGVTKRFRRCLEVINFLLIYLYLTKNSFVLSNQFSFSFAICKLNEVVSNK